MNLDDLNSEDYYPKTNDFFEFQEILGKGAFGTAICALNTFDKKQYAIKVIQKQSVSPSHWEQLRQEAFIMSELDHPNIVKFKEIRETEKRIYLIMELIKGGQLQDLINNRASKKKTFTDEEASTIVRGIIGALKHLHTKEIVHRDLKPENILVGDPNNLSTVKIADFGLSGHFGDSGFSKTFSQKVGTFVYMAPELAMNKQYSKPVDLWSCGIIMYMLLSGGKHPLYRHGDTSETLIEKLKNPKWDFGDNFTPLAQNFFLRLVNPDPLVRYTAEDAEKHSWLTRKAESSLALSTYEVMKSFSLEQSFSRVLKAMYLSVHVNAAERDLKPLPQGYDEIVKKAAEKPEVKIVDKPKNRSFLSEYNSIQSLIGTAQSKLFSPKNRESESPQSTKAELPALRHKESLFEITPLDKTPASFTVQTFSESEKSESLKNIKPVITIGKSESALESSEGLENIYAQKSLSTNAEEITQQDSLPNPASSPIINLKNSLNTYNIYHLMKPSVEGLLPRSARDGNNDSSKDSIDAMDSENDNTPNSNLKAPSPDESSEGSIDGARSTTAKGDFKTSKKSPFFHSAQKSTISSLKKPLSLFPDKDLLNRKKKNAIVLPEITPKSFKKTVDSFMTPKSDEKKMIHIRSSNNLSSLHQDLKSPFHLADVRVGRKVHQETLDFLKPVQDGVTVRITTSKDKNVRQKRNVSTSKQQQSQQTQQQENL